MAAKTYLWTDERLQRLKDCAKLGLTASEIAEKLTAEYGIAISTSSVQNCASVRGIRYGKSAIAFSASKPVSDIPTFSIDQAIDDEIPIEEILARKSRKFGLMAQSELEKSLISATVNIEGPYGVAFFGDPHLDNDGCDVDLLQEHIRICKRTPEILPACVGDYTDNWIGRLASLYGKSGTTEKQGWRLTEWFIESLDWLILVGGNHDAWSGGKDPVGWLASQAGIRYEMHGARIEIDAPDGSSLIVNTRHDFTGKSQYNPTWGPSKAAILGFRDDVYSCGHLHHFGYQSFTNPQGDRMHHCFRVGAYKRFDDYAKKIGAIENNATPCVGVLVNPKHEGNPYRYIQPAYCLEQLEDMVTAARLIEGYA